MDGDADVVTEIGAGLQVALVKDIAVEVSLGPDTLVGGSLDVTGVVHKTGVQLKCKTAVLFGLRDNALSGEEVIQGGVCVVIASFVAYLYAVILHGAKVPLPEVHAGSPVEVRDNLALEVGKDTQHLAAHAVVVDVGKGGIRGGGGNCLVLVTVGPYVVVLGCGRTVEAPQAVQGVCHVGYRCVHAHVGDKVLGVIRKVKTHAVAVGEVRAFPAYLVEGIRISGTVTIIINVTKGTCLETVVNRISCSGQQAEAPAFFHFFLLFLCKRTEAKSQHKC